MDMYKKMRPVVDELKAVANSDPDYDRVREVERLAEMWELDKEEELYLAQQANLDYRDLRRLNLVA
jgi:hypothetical protein